MNNTNFTSSALYLLSMWFAAPHESFELYVLEKQLKQ
jgi:hypothetical protein